jgi:tetratricopeptide (TPR) repeat protein
VIERQGHRALPLIPQMERTMSAGRIAGVALVAVAIAAAVIWSRLGDAAGRHDITTTAAPLASESGVAAEGELLDAPSLIAFWLARTERDPRDFISLTELGRAHMRDARETGDVTAYARAEAALQRALQLNDAYAPALTHLAAVRYAQHDFAEALALADRVSGVFPDDGLALAIGGDARLELGDYDGAGRIYTRLGEMHDSAPVLSRQARFAELHGRTDEALALMRRAADDAASGGGTAEGRAWYQLQLGHLLINAGDTSGAEERYNEALAIFPGYVHAIAGLARVEAARGDLDASIARYAEAVRRQPIPEYVAALGDAYMSAGRHDEAQQQYDLVLAIDRLYADAGIDTDLAMALFLADHGDPAEAVLRARAAHASRPSVYASDALAWALYRAGRYEEARAASAEALRLGTRDAIMLFHAGMIDAALGDEDAARTRLEEALALNPNFSLVHARTASETLRALTDG